MMSNSVKMKLAAGLFVPAVALAGTAFAQSDKATTGTPSATTGAPAAGAGMADKEALFKRLDTNNDGMLSAAEAQKDTKVHGAWKQLDASNKGSISKADFLAGYDKK
jgi:Skp family chaperone for outer membrane proteins